MVTVHLVGPLRVDRAGTELGPAEVGSRKGRTLLRLLCARRGDVLDAGEIVAALWPDQVVRMVVVTGPRIDPASLAAPAGVDVVGWLPDLHRMLAACDVALVQGGLTTTMELTAAGRPFVYVPLRHHFEQNIHVRRRLDRYGAGRCVPWEQASPERLADELAGLIGTRPDYRPVETDGAARAAALLAELL